MNQDMQIAVGRAFQANGKENPNASGLHRVPISSQVC